MKRLVALLVLIGVAALVPQNVAGRSPDRTSYDGQVVDVADDYYPLKVGNTWTYNSAGIGNVKLVNKVVAHEKFGGVMCAKIETSMGGQAIANEHIRVTADGIYRYSLNGMPMDKPVLILKLPARTGDQWKIKSKFGNETVTGQLKTTEEMVQVPAGKFKAVVAGGTMEGGGQTVEVSNYFVKGVGIAKIKMIVIGQTVEVDLEKFEPAK